AQRASDLTQQILDFSRRAVMERKPLNLRPFLKEQVRLLERTLPENVRIRMNYDEGEFMINADPTRIQQALFNLAINARDAMPHGGNIQINLEHTHLEAGQPRPIPEIEPGDWIRLEVADSGTGIQPEVLPHIFEPFFTTKEVGKGSGLGLAQVYGIVKQHEGHVDVTTKLGEGTQFIFYLPALPVSEKVGSDRQVEPVTAGSGELILVVEDDPVLRTAVASSLESLNYRVVAAANGRDAIALFDEYCDEIALVLSDVVMPVVGGKELLKTLRGKRPSLRAVVMTGHLLTEEVDELKAQGMVEWLQKPLRLEQLADAVARILAL
ncbi:MAG: ATP-binding protein, partial [Anaerolineae bacterium]